MDLETLRFAKFGLLDEAISDWSTTVTNLATLEKDAREGLKAKADKANWAGGNATVTREFVGKTVHEFNDAHKQAKSLWNILKDVRDELKDYRSQLDQALERARGKNLTVTTTSGGGFTVTMNIIHPDRAAKGTTVPDHSQSDVTALRDEIQKILDKATESDHTAAVALKALADQADLGFTGAEYKDRDSAAEAIKKADQLSAIAKKDPEDLTVKEFDQLNAGLKKMAGDELFTARFAEKLGARGTLDFWAGLNDPRGSYDLRQERGNQYDELQKNLSLTLATATQSDSRGMMDWKREMVDLGSQPISKTSGTLGFQVMSNLMRWGNYDDKFLTSYGSELIKTEKKLTDNGSHGAWARMGADPLLNRTGSDSGSDPMTGFMKALSNNPDAATEFFNDTFVTKDEDHDFEEDADKNGKNEKRELSNFDYLFGERDWPKDQNDKGDESVTGRNSMALALEAATTGHPAGEMPTAFTPAHNADQAALTKSVIEAVSEKPELLSDHGYMSDSLGQIAAEYMPDIHRSLNANREGQENLFPIAGSAASIKESDTTRFLYMLGRNPEGYAAVNVGQHSYTTHLMEYHFRNPDAFINDPEFSKMDNLKQTIISTAEVAGEIQGTIGAGRSYEGEMEGGAKDTDYNEAIKTTSTWLGSTVGIGVGIGTAPMIGPGGIITGGMAGTAADEIIGAFTEGMMKDSSGEVIYSNGQEMDATKESTYKLVEKAAEKAGERSGNPSPHIVASVAPAAEEGFNNASTNIRSSLDGEGMPRKLEEKK
ncbi:DUF6571 family protein [Streptomyces sp. ML-6]|uniref:DUF6571 family protein n=1 Tax=Streptomyces sp. ML-6 TaxID=2982693 RepID=UPI0024BFBEAF|nr:DUF6571 family protein [Streptomyces sp. ML-6]MDK0522635.1 hypothetical protein [Streptomyces sp. ML-6]